MKKVFRILMLYIIIASSFIIFNLNNIIAVGHIAQAWKVVEGGESMLLYRTFTTPHSTTIETYHKSNSDDLVGDGWTYTYNGKSYKAKWVKTNVTGTTIPIAGTFSTIGDIFHSEPIGIYTDISSGSNGYNKYTGEITKGITQELPSIQYALDNSKGQVAKIGENLNNKSTKVFYEIYNTTGQFTKVNWGTELRLTNPTATGKISSYRYTIVNINGQHIFVEDKVIYQDDLKELIKKANENNCLTSCYVSNVIISKTKHSSGGFEVSKSTYDFFRQYNKGATSFWSASTRGVDIDSKSLGAVANLYDNILCFPQKSSRRVYVRHYNIENNTSISKDIIKKATSINSEELFENYILIGEDGGGIWSEIGDSYEEVYTKDNIGIDQSITKTAIDNKYYKCIGYNSMTETDLYKAITLIGRKESGGLITQGDIVKIDAKTLSDDSDCTVIDFYYTEYDKDVYVNHILVDENGKICDSTLQVIKPNNSAIITGEGKYKGQTVERINTDINVISEVYNKKLGYGLKVGIVNNLDNAKYLGNETYSAYTDIKYNEKIDKKSLSKAQEITLENNKVQVNFYYEVTTRSGKEPDKNIDGKLFINALDSSTTCVDTENNEISSVVSMPSGVQATLGIKNIPRYMVGAINTEEANSKSTLKFKVNLKVNGNTKTVEYELPYDFSFYRVSDFAVYELDSEIIYDSDYDGNEVNGVLGDNLFDWKQKSIMPTEFNHTLNLTGVNGKKINNNTSDIKNINNYVEIKLIDNNLTENKIQLSEGVVPVINITNSSNLDEFDDILSKGDYNALRAYVAKQLGLRLNIKIQNMDLTIDNGKTSSKIFDSSSNTNNAINNIYDLSNKNIYNETILMATQRSKVNIDNYNAVKSTMITESSYSNTEVILSSAQNGIRLLAGKVTYKTKLLIGNSSNQITDNEYYLNVDESNKNLTFKLDIGKTISKKYEVNNQGKTREEKYEYVEPINIYTPISVSASVDINNNQAINQVSNSNLLKQVSAIQVNKPFKIEFSNLSLEKVYNLQNTEKFAGVYYIKFDFDVHKVIINGKSYKEGKRVSKGTWIEVPRNNSLTKEKPYITVQVYGNEDDNKVDVINEDNGSFTVRAIAYNANDFIKEQINSFATKADLESSSSVMEFFNNICNAPSYFAEETYGITILNRVYDFRITDLKDINWKNIFRKTNGTDTNKHTGVVYYSGITKVNDEIVDSNNNSIVNRGTIEIGNNPLRTLPLGPYKNTDITYIKAPKLGYRFSYDMKVTGSYWDKNGKPREYKKVAISTKFYFVSKDGKTYLKEYDGKSAGIYLFYKNSSGKYVRIDGSGGGYKLYFTPNDGYRYIQDRQKNTLASNELSLGNLRHLTLTSNMATVSDNYSYITYYGEYKLPNSTIAVKVNLDGSYDINKPLKDGYIGVVFDIVAYSGKINLEGTTYDAMLSYSKNTKENPNTSQWDYEGFLGYTKYGSEVQNSLRIKLEKGYWNIDNNIYNDIKGSVILYDSDLRADNDYE